MFRSYLAGVAMILALGVLCGFPSPAFAADEGSWAEESEKVQQGRIRIVPADRVADSAQWGDALDYDLEAEFWDIVGNNGFGTYPQWRDKVAQYNQDNAEAAPRLKLLLAAGGVFALTPAFQDDLLGGPGTLADFPYIYDATVALNDAIGPLTHHEPAVVFYHNNNAMLALLLSAGTRKAEGLCHLEQLRVLETLNTTWVGTEGLAAAPFTYGFVNDPAYLDYAISMIDDCNNGLCNWTSKLAPFKPIGELMMLGELYYIRWVTDPDPNVRSESWGKYRQMFARAEQLAIERNWPYIDRIAEVMAELESRTEYGQHPNPLLVGVRHPMPVYANEDTCSNCHIGGLPQGFGQVLDDPYRMADTPWVMPDPPAFQASTPGYGLADCALDNYGE